MQGRKTALALAITAAFGGITAPLLAGPEIQVNTSTAGAQANVDTAMDANGNFVVVWSGGYYSNDHDIFFQRYDVNGAAQGGETVANTYTTGGRGFPAVAMSSGGGFVVVWNDPHLDASGGLRGRTFSAAGSPGSEFQINTYSTGYQGEASVAMDSNGFVVAWHGDGASGRGIYARRFDSSGVALGSDFKVSTATTGTQEDAHVAMDASGNFVVAWDDWDLGIHARTYTAAGAGALVRRVEGDSYATWPGVAMRGDGKFLVVWADSPQIWGRHYDAAGKPLAQRFQVNTFEQGPVGSPSVAMNASGDYIIGWTTDLDGHVASVAARVYVADAGAATAEFRVNTYTTNNQRYPDVGIDATGNFVVAWQSYEQDGLSETAMARINPTGPKCLPGTISFAPSRITVAESVGTVPVTVSRTGGKCNDVSVKLTGIDGTATRASYDYSGVYAGGGIGWYHGDNADKIVNLSIGNDTADERDEKLYIKMSQPDGGAVLPATRQAEITITDDDPMPTVAFFGTSTSVDEGFTRDVSLKLSAPAGRNVSVPLSFAGTAVKLQDYAIIASPIEFKPGEQTKIIPVKALSDNAVEGNETMIMKIGSPTNAVKGSSYQYTTTILDNDD